MLLKEQLGNDIGKYNSILPVSVEMCCHLIDQIDYSELFNPVNHMDKIEKATVKEIYNEDDPRSNRYWYTDDNIEAIGKYIFIGIKNPDGSDFNINTQFKSRITFDLIKSMFENDIKGNISNFQENKPIYICYNIGGNSELKEGEENKVESKEGKHWVGICIIKQGSNLNVLYKDPYGVDNFPEEIEKVQDEFRRCLAKLPDNILHFQAHTIHDQEDGYACGPMTLNNLGIMARHIYEQGMDSFINNFEALEFSKQNDVPRLRKQYYVYIEKTHSMVMDEEKKGYNFYDQKYEKYDTPSEHKQKILKNKTDQVIYLPEEILQLDTIEYSATKTAESGHPNADEKLVEEIRKVLGADKQPVNSIDFHQTIYRTLEFKHHYYFKHKISNDITITTDNLLTWLLVCNSLKEAKKLIHAYKFDILNIIDDNGNNILHTSSLLGNYAITAAIFKEYKYKKDILSKLTNHHNKDGTIPLGMVFLNPQNLESGKSEARTKKIVKLFIAEEACLINSYLNNGKGMDCLNSGFLQQIGGFNILHISIIKGWKDILEELGNRNDDLGWRKSPDDICNFFYPSLNPNHHMWSPKKFFTIDSLIEQKKDKLQILRKDAGTINKKLTPLKNGKLRKGYDKKNLEDDLGQINRKIELLNNEIIKLDNISKRISSSDLNKTFEFYLNKQISVDNADDSGDSSDEESFAGYYKQALLRLTAKLEEKDQEEKENDGSKVFIPHFHGVPFMQGQYTNYHRREIAKIFLEEEGCPKELHSRTSTAGAGIDTLYQLIVQTQDTLQKLDEISNELIKNLALCWQRTTAEEKKQDGSDNGFVQELSRFIYEFSQDESVRTFWENLDIMNPVGFKEIIKYRFPFVSTSKAPDHAMKFALGSRVEDTLRGEKPLHIQYNTEGYPNHRLAGLLFISLHEDTELLVEVEDEKGGVDISKLIKIAQIHSKNPQGGIISSPDQYIDFQLEFTFFGKLDHIVAVIPIIYPNLSKNFNKGYHDDVWRIQDINHNRNDLNPSTRHIDVARNATLDAITNMITPAFIKMALKLAEKIAKSQGGSLAYFSAEGKEVRYPANITQQGSEAQKEIQKYIDRRGQNENLKKTITKDTLRSNEQTIRDKYTDEKYIFIDGRTMPCFSVYTENIDGFYKEVIIGENSFFYSTIGYFGVD